MNINWLRTKRTNDSKTVGTLLHVGLPLLNVDNIIAKVDTGAFSGSMHADNIKEVKSATGNQLQFVPHGKNAVISVDNFHHRRVKSSSGHISDRYAIDTDIVILGKTYPITITLSNRSSMKYPMLIGRNFLQTHGFLVDVSINNE